MRRRNKKLHGIRYKITRPFIATIIIIPLILLIIFNIFMLRYVNKTEKQTLIKAANAMNTLIESQYTTFSKLIPTVIPSARKAALVTNNIDVIILDKNKNLLFPAEVEDTFITDDLIDKVSIDCENKEPFVVYLFFINKTNYITTFNTLDYVTDTPYIIYVSRMSSTNSLQTTINSVIVSILTLGIVLNIILTLFLSKSISKPIQTLSENASKLASGTYVPTEPTETSSELYKLHLILNETADQLEQYDKNQRSFLQNISHELRTPLMSIQGYSEGILKDILPDNKMAAQIIYNESNRLTLLIAQILTLSRVESNMFQANMITTNLSNIIKDYIQRIEGLAIKEEKKMNVNINSENIPVIIDEELLSQAIVNILSNCIKYAEKSVSIHTYTTTKNAIIHITDDGNGFDEKDLPHLFDRFYKGKNGNFGLGLAIAKSSIEAMSGSIQANNTKTGAEFIITIPLAGTKHQNYQLNIRNSKTSKRKKLKFSKKL